MKYQEIPPYTSVIFQISVKPTTIIQKESNNMINANSAFIHNNPNSKMPLHANKYWHNT